VLAVAADGKDMEFRRDRGNKRDSSSESSDSGARNQEGKEEWERKKRNDSIRDKTTVPSSRQIGDDNYGNYRGSSNNDKGNDEGEPEWRRSVWESKNSSFKFSTISWNADKTNHLEDILLFAKKHQIDAILLQEVARSNISAATFRRYGYVISMRTTGSQTAIALKKSTAESMEVIESKEFKRQKGTKTASASSMLFKIRGVELGITSVYLFTGMDDMKAENQDFEAMKELLQEVTEFASKAELWLVAGDFNEDTEGRTRVRADRHELVERTNAKSQGARLIPGLQGFVNIGERFREDNRNTKSWTSVHKGMYACLDHHLTTKQLAKCVTEYNQIDTKWWSAKSKAKIHYHKALVSKFEIFYGEQQEWGGQESYRVRLPWTPKYKLDGMQEREVQTLRREMERAAQEFILQIKEEEVQERSWMAKLTKFLENDLPNLAMKLTGGYKKDQQDEDIERIQEQRLELQARQEELEDQLSNEVGRQNPLTQEGQARRNQYKRNNDELMDLRQEELKLKLIREQNQDSKTKRSSVLNCIQDQKGVLQAGVNADKAMLDHLKRLFVAKYQDPICPIEKWSREGAKLEEYEFRTFFKNKPTAEDLKDLMEPFSREFIMEQINKFKKKTSPGMSGLTIELLKIAATPKPKEYKEAYTYFVLEVVSIWIEGCLHWCDLPALSKNTLVVPIPKKGDVLNSVTNIRPIGIQGVLSRLLSKGLAYRLGSLITKYKLIDEAQYGFLPGGNIYDPLSLLLNIVEDHKAKKNLILLKYDVESAYPSLRWESIQLALETRGLKGKFLKFVMNSLSESAMYCKLGKGWSTIPFYATKSVKQGDPLAPLLFILAIDDLHRGLRRINAGYRLSSGEGKDKHLKLRSGAYADDLFLVADSWEDIKLMNNYVEKFMSWHGFRMNTNKCQMAGRLKQGKDILDLPEVLKYNNTPIHKVSTKNPIYVLGLLITLDLDWAHQMRKMEQTVWSAVANMKLPRNKVEETVERARILESQLELSFRFANCPKKTVMGWDRVLTSVIHKKLGGSGKIDPKYLHSILGTRPLWNTYICARVTTLLEALNSTKLVSASTATRLQKAIANIHSKKKSLPNQI
jgi:exonuclease III